MGALLGGPAVLRSAGRPPGDKPNLYGRNDHAATARALRRKIEDWQRRTADTLPLQN